MNSMRQAVKMERELARGAVPPARRSSSRSGVLCLLQVWLPRCERLNSALQSPFS